MNSLFENGGRKIFISAYTRLRVGNNIDEIDKKLIPASIHPWKLGPVVQEMLFKEKVYRRPDAGQRPITIPDLEPLAQVS